MVDKIIQEDTESIINSIGSDFKKIAGKTFLITGANGFIASYLVDTLLRLNEALLKENPVHLILSVHHKVTRNSRLGHCLKNKRIKFVVGDIVQKNLPKKIDVIIHAASKASPKEYLSQLVETADVNVLGTKKLLEYSAKEKVSKFVLISSGEIYGNPDPQNIPIPETYNGNVDPIGPRATYQESKRFSETLCYLYWKARRVDTVIVRLFHTYGPRLSLNDGRVVPEFIRRALMNEKIELIDGGKAIRAFSYISDSIAGIFKVLLHGQSGQAYNVGSEEEINMKDLAEKIIRLTSSKSKVQIVPGAAIAHSIATPDRNTPSTKKLAKLGYKNKISLEKGLSRLIAWYQNQK